ncbi:hypothetical protein CIPAW_12G129100 [Carya illinoinensis]|uniref:Uncharacterized protein n=1 Tax=Carya illinoinensis TaxID=32201 RepID=A0A8T1NVW9_CARIL|nr:hypothetical protein CIPAW_12G129100 [Carya illinoinensis]
MFQRPFLHRAGAELRPLQGQGSPSQKLLKPHLEEHHRQPLSLSMEVAPPVGPMPKEFRPISSLSFPTVAENWTTTIGIRSSPNVRASLVIATVGGAGSSIGAWPIPDGPTSVWLHCFQTGPSLSKPGILLGLWPSL